MFEINDISTITTRDMFEIIGTFASVTDNKFNCNACINQFGARPERENTLKLIRTNKGCWDSQPRPSYIHNRVLLFHRCPGSFWDATAFNLIKLHQNDRNLVHQDFFEQPAKLVEAFHMLDNLQAEHQHKLNKEAQKKHGKRSKR